MLSINTIEIAQHLAMAFFGSAEAFEAGFLEVGIEPFMPSDGHAVAGAQEGENGFKGRAAIGDERACNFAGHAADHGADGCADDCMEWGNGFSFYAFRFWAETAHPGCVPGDRRPERAFLEADPRGRAFRHTPFI